MHRHLELPSRCQSVHRGLIDLSSILSDTKALQQLVNDIYRPFDALVDQVIALHVEETITPDDSNCSNNVLANDRDKMRFAVVSAKVHHFTAAVAGAMAGAKKLAYGEVSVLRKKEAQLVNREAGSTILSNSTFKCKQIISMECGDGKFCVEMKRTAIKATAKILLVLDWVSEVESILAARNALTKLGFNVIGVSFVIATNSNVLSSLKAAQVTASCVWTPSHGVKQVDTSLSRNNSSNESASCTCDQAAKWCRQGSQKRQRSAGNDLDPSVQVLLSYRTAEYQANNPSEDRSVNIVKAMDKGVQINAIFDGHGGSMAVEHLRTSLCQHILADVASNKSSDEVLSIIKNAFSGSDEKLKQSLLALPLETRMSKGYCNAGACAVIALFVKSVLYVANVGDCAAVLGKADKETQVLQAIEVSVDHSCSNPRETRLVIERSHDRNAIRTSKVAGADTIGVKRVAGSLAMTRALGDFYLKCPELSSPPFKSNVPYITSEPSITTVSMDGSEQFLILASDGLWDVMTPEEAVCIVDKFDPEQTLFFTTASAALIHAALEKIAHRDGLMMHELMSIPQGSLRRRLHDDITCTVVYINH